MKRTLLLLLMLGACSGKPSGEDAEVKPTAQVTTAAAMRGDIPETVAAYGAVEIAPGAEHTLVAPVEAVVASIQAPAGAAVHAGDVVVTLAPSPTSRLDLDKAVHDAETSQAAYARAQRLRAAGLDSDADVEAARAAAQTAEAARASLAARSSALTLRAPVDGVVESLTLAPGDMAAAGAAVAKVGALNDLRLRLGVEPQIAARLRRGAGVTIRPLAGAARAGQRAQVIAVDARADPQTRLAAVIVQAPPGAGLVPGQPAAGDIVVAEHAGALLIPRAALLYEQDKPYVFVVVQGAAHRHDVTLGASDETRVGIVKGLAPGDRVVVEGAAALDDGMAVREGGAPAKDEAKDAL